MAKVQAIKSAMHVLPEALVWGLGFVLLACMKPGAAHLFSLCPVSWFWESGCPGCGLGNSIAYLFQGDMAASWQAHPLGLPVLALLLVRIGRLLLLSQKLYNYHKHL